MKCLPVQYISANYAYNLNLYLRHFKCMQYTVWCSKGTISTTEVDHVWCNGALKANNVGFFISN